MRALALAVAALLAAGPLWAEKGDIYDCKFKLKRGQWLTEKVIAGIGHGSGKAKVYDGMIHFAHGKPIAAEIGRNDDSRLIFLWTVFVDGPSGTSRKVHMRLSYIKKNGRATITSRLAGFENHYTARGKCKTSVGQV